MAKKADNKKDQNFQGSQLHFFGDRQHPDKLDKLLDRRSIHGDRKVPSELRKLMTTKSIYKSTGKDSEKPKVNIELLKSPGSENTWKIDIPVNEKYLNPQNALPGTRNIINLFNVTSPLVKFFFQNNLLFIYWNLENINQKFFNILLSECLAIDLFDLNYSGGTEKKRKLIAY